MTKGFASAFSRLVAFSAFLMASSLAVAGSKSSADFLKIPVGAQGASLGQAYTALADGVEALNWNPAGIAVAPSFAETSTLGVSVTHQEHVFETSLDQLGLVMPANRSRATSLGVNVLRLAYGAQEQRSADRQKTGTFESYDMAVGFSAARNFNGLFTGMQLKLLRQQLAGYTAQGFALDLGLQGAGPINRMYYGVSVKNLGPQMKFVDEAFHLPLTISVGTAYRVTGPLSISVDLHSRPYQDQVNVAMGAQFAASRSVALRAGYMAKVAESVANSQKSESNRGNFGGMGGIGAGLGIRLSRFMLDYAMTPFGELGNTQTITVSSWFGGRPAPRRELDIMIDDSTPKASSKPAAKPVVAPQPKAAPAAKKPAQQPAKPMLDVPLDHEDWWNRMR